MPSAAPSRSRLSSAAAVLATVLLGSSFVSGFVLLHPLRRWFPEDLPRLITVDSRGLASVTDGDGGVTRAVAAVQAWNDAGQTVTSGQAGSVTYDLRDGKSDLVFGDPLGICVGSCIAVTTTGYFDTRERGVCDGLRVSRITDSDVAVNTAFDFTTAGETDACSNEIFLESVVAHEVGHVIGLDHSRDREALMYPSLTYCANKTLTADDIAGRDELYDCAFSGGGQGCSGGRRGDPCAAGEDCCSGRCRGRIGATRCR